MLNQTELTGTSFNQLQYFGYIRYSRHWTRCSVVFGSVQPVKSRSYTPILQLNFTLRYIRSLLNINWPLASFHSATPSLYHMFPSLLQHVLTSCLSCISHGDIYQFTIYTYNHMESIVLSLFILFSPFSLRGLLTAVHLPSQLWCTIDLAVV